MKFSESKQIFNDWNNYKSLLSEITDKEKNIIRDRLKEIAKDKESLTFDSIFGDKLRISVPIPYDPKSDDSVLGKMLNELAIAGWAVDLNSGLASKEYETEFNGVKRTQKRSMKINAIWTTFLDLLRKHETIFRDAFQKNPNLADLAAYTANNPQLNKITSQLIALMGQTIASQYFSGMAFKKAEQTINGFIKTWQTEAAKIKGMIENGSGYSMIISRHPIDVLRMSDYKNITSCHSPPSTPKGQWAGGGGYYACAVAEARSGGLIAMLVRTSDLEGVDLQKEEVFEDQTRDLEGLEPLSRIRLRMIMDEDGYAIAIPEKRVYGPDIVDFSGKLKQWATTTQAKEFSRIITKAKKNNNEIVLDNFTLFGGSYLDNSMDILLKNLKDSIPELKKITLSGEIHFHDSIQKEAERDVAFEQFPKIQPTINKINKTLAQKNIPVRCEEKSWSLEEGYLHPKAYYYIDISQLEHELKDNYEQSINTRLLDFLTSHMHEFGLFDYVDHDNIPIFYKDEKGHPIIKIYFRESSFSEFGITTPEQIEEYMVQVSDSFMEHKETIIKTVQYYLINEQVLEGSAFVNLRNDILNGDFARTPWAISVDEGDVFFSPQLIYAELPFSIPYRTIPKEKFTTSVMQKLKLYILNTLLPKSKDKYEFDIIYDNSYDSENITYNLNIEDNIKDDDVAKIIKFLNMSKQETKDYLIKFLQSTNNPTVTEGVKLTKLKEFKNVSNNWKKFLT